MLSKIIFDYIFAFILLLLFGWIILILILLASISTHRFGLYSQTRIGKHAKRFQCYKIRTMYVDSAQNTITTHYDQRITRLGKFLRKYKLDELPQLLNILLGDMSFVGPRPDVAGYADKLMGPDRIILTFKPGITAPATLKYRNEEFLLAQQPNPQEYNDTIIWPDKIKLNKDYVENWSFSKDLKIIFQTIFV